MTLIVSSAMIMVMDNTKGKKQKSPEAYTPDQLSKLKLKPEKKQFLMTATKPGGKKSETVTLTFECAKPKAVKLAVEAVKAWNESNASK